MLSSFCLPWLCVFPSKRLTKYDKVLLGKGVGAFSSVPSSPSLYTACHASATSTTNYSCVSLLENSDCHLNLVALRTKGSIAAGEPFGERKKKTDGFSASLVSKTNLDVLCKEAARFAQNIKKQNPFFCFFSRRR